MLISLVVDVYCKYISWQAGRVLSAPLVVARLIQGAAAVGWMAHWLACCLLACLAKAGLLASWLAGWLATCLACLPTGVRTTQRMIWGPFLENKSPGRIPDDRGETWDGNREVGQPAGPTCKKFAKSDRQGRMDWPLFARLHHLRREPLDFPAYLGKRRGREGWRMNGGARCGSLENRRWYVENQSRWFSKLGSCFT